MIVFKVCIYTLFIYLFGERERISIPITHTCVCMFVCDLGEISEYL